MSAMRNIGIGVAAGGAFAATYAASLAGGQKLTGTKLDPNPDLGTALFFMMSAPAGFGAGMVGGGYLAGKVGVHPVIGAAAGAGLLGGAILTLANAAAIHG